MKTKKLFLCLVMVVVALALFEYANAELEFRSNSKVSLPDPTPADVGSKPSIPINQSPQKILLIPHRKAFNSISGTIHSVRF